MDTLDRVMAARGETDEQSAWYWCQTVSSAAQALREGDSADLAELQTKLTEAELPEESIEALVHVLEEVGVATALDEIGQAGAEGLYAYHRAAAPEAATAESQESWWAFVAQNGAAWDGQEESWPDFRNWFLHYATEAGVGGYATEFLDVAESSSDKAAVFAQYGLTITAPSQLSSAGAPADAQSPTPADAASPAPSTSTATEVDDGFEEGDLAGLFGGIDMDDEELDEAMAEIAAMSDEEYAALVAEIEAETDRADQTHA
jgi:hypothetical protein